MNKNFPHTEAALDRLINWCLSIALLSFIVLCALGILSGCNSAQVKKPIDILTPEVSQAPQIQDFMTPTYSGGKYPESIALIKKWAVHPEFTTFVIKKRTYFSHTEGTVIENMAKYTMMMGAGFTIPIKIYWNPASAALGGWHPEKQAILENSAKKLSVTRRAAHLLHETTHVLGWKHSGNYPEKFDNVNSFPYTIGYLFEEFLVMKLGPGNQVSDI